MSFHIHASAQEITAQKALVKLAPKWLHTYNHYIAYIRISRSSANCSTHYYPMLVSIGTTYFHIAVFSMIIFNFRLLL